MMKLRWLVALLMVVGSFNARAVDITGWAKQMRITFPGYAPGETLTNFTAQVKLSAGISGFAYSQFASGSGYDLRFTDGSTNDWLAYEIEKWDTAGNSYIWVKVPSLKAATNILAFWGNGAEVSPQVYTTNGSAWSGTYIGVWHLNEAAGPFKDATANGNHSAQDSNTTQSGGPSGLHYARKFTGGTSTPPGTSFIYFAESPSLLQQWADLTTSGYQVVTIEAWAKPTVTGLGNHQRIMAMEGSYGWTLDQMNLKTWLVQNNFQATQRASQVTIQDGNWHHIVYTLQGNTNWCNIYVDGKLEISDRLHDLGGDTNKAFRTHKRKYADFCLGAGKSQNATTLIYTEIEPFNGDIAEARVSKVVRSAAWANASYLTVASNATFQAYAAVETVGEGNPVVPPVVGEPAKNVIILFGDGMSWGAIQAARYFLGRPMYFESLFPYTNTLTTFPADYPTGHAYTDSGAAATAIFTGHKVNYYVLGQAIPPDAGFTTGQDYTNLCEFMQARGKSVGCLTDMYINDATPGGFLTHDPNRTNYSAVIDDMFLRARPNLIWGGFAGERPPTWVGDWTDRLMRPNRATDAGYSLVTNRTDLLALATNNPNLYSCALFTPPQGPEIEWGSMGFDTPDYNYGNQPHLREMATKAIDILQNNTNGFCALIEAGVIDVPLHWNNISNLVYQMAEFDRTVSNVMTWAQGRTDTLVIVCSDHDVGGLTNVVNNGVGKIPGGTWTATSHTSIPVPAFAWGKGASALTNANVTHLTNLFYILTGQAAAGEAATNEPPVTNITVAANNWTAYNDFQYVIHDLTYRITSLGVTGTTNPLMNFDSGYLLPATVAFSGVASSLLSVSARVPGGSDADAEFTGKVTLHGLRTWAAGTMTITISNLNPARRYRFALHGDSGATSTHWTDVNVADVDGFVNDSSAGASVLTTSVAQDTTRLPADNSNGWVARFTDIQPGPDGDVSIRITAGGSSGAGAYINGLIFGVLPLSEQLPEGASWHYLDDGSNPGTAWRTGFASDSWLSGPAPLGYGNAGSLVSNSLNTVVGYGPSSTAKYITTYFRTAVVVDDPASLPSNVTFSALIDDGAVLHLNGTPVWSFNMPGTYDYSTLASGARGIETNVLTFTVPGSTFVAGTNWLAAEVHQSAPDSSDILFSLWAEGLLGGTSNELPVIDPEGWVAYNDLSWASGQLENRLTKLTFLDDADHDLSGRLVKYADGSQTPVTMTLSAATSAGLWVTTNQGAPNAGTPGYQYFDGKVDMNRTVYVNTPNTATITLSGMDPSRRYKVVVLGNRGDLTYTTRTTVITLGGADSFTNASTPGALISGTLSETTSIVTGTNVGGQVFIYTGVAPGSDGQIQLTVGSDAGNTASWYLNSMAVELLPTAAASGDSDADGMDDAWEQANFGGTGAANGGMLEDWDNDGSSNYDEYRAGTDPTSSGSKFELTGASATNTAAQVVLRWSSVAGKTYAIQYGTNLTTALSTLQSGIPATAPLNVYTAAIGSTKGFIRIKIE